MSNSTITTRPTTVIDLPKITRGALMIAGATAPIWLPIVIIANHVFA